MILDSVYWEWMPLRLCNMTLGLHSQEFEAYNSVTDERAQMIEFIAGFLFFRIVFSFINR